ncbi:MAG: hypothetical protein E7637_04330 [Ruminococcaceae bacterium]|nr:hypothetical protein [Oscillospiraceae bacterium]
MIITFLGHRSIHTIDEVRKKLEHTIAQNLKSDEKTLFYCGGYGTFDNLCASVCHAFRKRELPCEVVYITPYITESHQKKMKDLLETKLYDSVIYPPLESTPLKYAIIKRNEWMIQQADLIIAYVDHSHGGAYKSLVYAEKKQKKIINLTEL